MAKSTRSSPTSAGIKVAASKTCPSLSGKCTIAYKVGRDDEGALHLRLHDNTGGGFFNNDWIPAQALADILSEHAGPDPITSRVLAPLFHRRSANTPAFFAAALRNEGALLQHTRTSRLHLVGDLDAFLRQETPQAGSRKSPKKKAPAKKKKTSRSKSKASTAK